LDFKKTLMKTDRLNQRYERVYKQLKALLEGEPDKTARMATIAAVLHHKFNHFFWTGFYLKLDNGFLLVGPYQGPVACKRLPPGKGVCQAALTNEKIIIVPDVEQFPGHIACDSRSKSEIVVPIKDKTGTIIGVMDIDSRIPDIFSEVDANGLEPIAALVSYD